MSDRRNRQSLLLPIGLPVGILLVIGLVLFGFSRILLNISHTAATIVAVIAATAIVVVAALVATRTQVGGSALFSAVGAVAGVAMLAGGLAVIAAPLDEHGEAGEAQTVTLAAPVGASTDGFDPKKLDVAADVPIAMEFDNQETGVQHNVVVFDGEDAEAPALFTGTLISGPDSITYTIEPLPEGGYFFHCEVHPTTMTGEIAAAPGAGRGEGGEGEGGGGEGGGGGGLAIAAQGLQFSTSELAFPADTPSTLAFDNQDDASTTGPHNVAIYDGDTGLFVGELVEGPAAVDYEVPGMPAGEYEFRCDVHPDMAGTATVS